MGFFSWLKRSQSDSADAVALDSPPAQVAIAGGGAEQQRTNVTNMSLDQIAELLVGSQTRAGVVINERNAMTYIAVFAATKILSEAVGMLPAMVFEGDEDDTDHRPALTHPLRPLLRYEPNPEMNAAVWKETIQSHLCLWGNAYNRIIRSQREEIIELRPLDPSRVNPERKAGKLVYRYEPQRGDRSEEFEPRDILHIPALGFDGLVGYSPIAMARQNLGIAVAAETYGANFFGAGTNMTGIVSFDGAMTPQQQSQFKANWQIQKAGLQKSGNTIFLDRGAKYSRVGLPPNDAQFLDTRKFGVLDVCRLYRIPPHMMGDLEKASYATIEQQGLEFLIYTLMPYLVKYELEFKRKLLGIDSPHFVTFDASQLLRGDMAAQQAFFANGRQQGYLSVNEIRHRLRMSDIAGGDTYLEPQNMRPLGSSTAGEPSSNVPAPTNGNQPGLRSEVLVPVFTDALARMYKIEINARSRADYPERSEEFQARHLATVRAAIEPGVRAFCQMRNVPFDQRAETVIAEFSTGSVGAAAKPDVEAYAREQSAVLLLRLHEAVTTN